MLLRLLGALNTQNGRLCTGCMRPERSSRSPFRRIGTVRGRGVPLTPQMSQDVIMPSVRPPVSGCENRYVRLLERWTSQPCERLRKCLQALWNIPRSLSWLSQASSAREACVAGLHSRGDSSMQAAVRVPSCNTGQVCSRHQPGQRRYEQPPLWVHCRVREVVMGSERSEVPLASSRAGGQAGPSDYPWKPIAVLKCDLRGPLHRLVKACSVGGLDQWRSTRSMVRGFLLTQVWPVVLSGQIMTA